MDNRRSNKTVSSPPYRVEAPGPGPVPGQDPASTSTDGQNEQSTGSKFSVASHSIRITRQGYAIEPVELKYTEVLNNLTSQSRRLSFSAFNPYSPSQTFLSLIRGFWSQASFPKGRQVKSGNLSIESVLYEFSQNPTYPHSNINGQSAKDRLFVNVESSKKSRKRKSRLPRFGKTNDTTATTKTSASKQADPETSLRRSSTPSESGLFAPISSSTSSKSKYLTVKKKVLAPNTYHSWVPDDRSSIADLIIRLCQQMEEVLASEPRILEIQKPCIVMGDIHGNLTDLRTYERSLWPKAPVCPSSKYLFLGDYVDRGDFSVECILYLMSMKLIAPNNFFLLRGNHEVAAIQKQYTFSKECETKFGLYGLEIWRSFNKVFDMLPVAAVIDKKIFCAHGGIPRSISNIAALKQEIPAPMDNPEMQCPSAWEILWNDPITDTELLALIEMDNIPPSARTDDSQEINARKDVATESTVASKEATGAAADHKRVGSFYIRFEEKATKQQQPAQKEAPPAPPPPSRDVDNNRDSDNLRNFPSDTSSIASTSPQQMIDDGFAPNIKRGTGYLFSDRAIKNFLQINKFSHVIRAHEVIPTGFAFHGDGRVITIFSSSKYCGLNNQVACALVDGDRIRILRLDTSDEGE